MKTLIIAKRARTRAENGSPQFLVGLLGRQLDDIGPPPGQNWIVSRKWTLQQRSNSLVIERREGKSRLPWLAYYATAPLPGRKTRTNVQLWQTNGNLRFPVADIVPREIPTLTFLDSQTRIIRILKRKCFSTWKRASYRTANSFESIRKINHRRLGAES